METSLRDKTLELLKAKSSPSFIEIQKATKIKYDWLSKFSQGLIDDPSVNKIQTLYNYLSKVPLKV